MMESDMLIFPAGYAPNGNKECRQEPHGMLAAKHKHERHLFLFISIMHDGLSKTQMLISHLPLPSQPSLTRRSNSSPTSLTPKITHPTRGTRNRHRRHRSRTIARYRRCRLQKTPLIRLGADNALFQTLESDGGLCRYGGCGTCWGSRCRGCEGCHDLDWHEGFCEGEGECAVQVFSYCALGWEGRKDFGIYLRASSST